MTRDFPAAGVRNNFAKYLRKLIGGNSHVMIGRTNDGWLYVYTGYVALHVPEQAYSSIIAGVDKSLETELERGTGIEIENGKRKSIRTVEIASRFERAWNTEGCVRVFHTQYSISGDRILALDENPRRPIYVPRFSYACFDHAKWSWASSHPRKPLIGIGYKHNARAIMCPSLGHIQPSPVDFSIANEFTNPKAGV